ncbi:hypothetical protein [uncultured Brachyspira sp.]|uniref:hypothetical protein n=1 Tax=uncultured Brachyspira sp. TaxID=221953 RepID=UPI0025D95BF0|nr:hypothetical protein [uncultured Brachyspira sp.]
MNIEFLLSAVFDNRRVIPSQDRLFKAIVSSLNEVNINPLVMISEFSIIEDGSTLIYSFHPSADPIYFEFKTDTLFITISTGSFGAGYHKFIVGVLDRIARRLDIEFKEDPVHKDPSGYFKSRDFEQLKKFFISSLADYSKMLITHHENGFSNFMISMPYDYPIIEKEYFALSSLGYWGKNWFTDFLDADEESRFIMAADFFLWDTEEMNAKFWFKSFISMIWLYFPFREAIDNKEKTMYKKIMYSFQEAYKKDSNLRYPWNILVDISHYLDDVNLAKFIESKKNSHQPNMEIGFRLENARYSIAAGFTIVLPMRMNVFKNDKSLIEFKDINIYIAMQVYSFANEETDVIMEYVLKQMDIAEEDKGVQIDIKSKNSSIESIVYEKELDDNDHIITAAFAAKKLALLSWFTYSDDKYRDFCIEAVKSIDIEN